MKSPCKIDVRTPEKQIGQSGQLGQSKQQLGQSKQRKATNSLIKQALDEAQQEALRLEDKFSRFRVGNLVHRINQGTKVTLDTEFEQLLRYAEKCHHISNGLFDITAGPLKKIWSFHEGFQFPDDATIKKVLPFVGFDKISWQESTLQLPKGMELDFGGLVKEYAVDRCALILKEKLPTFDFLIHFGGDLLVSGNHTIGIENPKNLNRAIASIQVSNAGIATSGTSRQYIERNGIRYSHILNPQTGYPIENAPLSVTVVAPTCIEAGFLATLAILQGKNAQAFCQENQLTAWCF